MPKLLIAFLTAFLTLPVAAAPKKPTAADETVYQLRRLLHTQLLDECRSSERTGAEGNVKGRVEEGDFDATGTPTFYMPAPEHLDAWLSGWREYFQQNKIPTNANQVRCAWDTKPDSFEYVRGAVYTDAAHHACSKIGTNPPICMYVKAKQLCKSVGGAKPTCQPL